MRIDIDYTLNNTPESIMVAMRRNPPPGSPESASSATGRGVKQLEKAFSEWAETNESQIDHPSTGERKLQSHDLNLLRSGPKFRRDWIDAILNVLKPHYKTVMASYQKIILQRNRLLKQLFEKGRVSVSDTIN